MGTRREGAIVFANRIETPVKRRISLASPIEGLVSSQIVSTNRIVPPVKWIVTRDDSITVWSWTPSSS